MSDGDVFGPEAPAAMGWHLPVSLWPVLCACWGGGENSSPGAVGLSYFPLLFPFFFNPLPHIYSSLSLHYTSQCRLLAPGPCPGSHLPPWSKGCPPGSDRDPDTSCVAIWALRYPGTLQWVAWAPGMTHAQGEAAELPAATEDHGHPAQDCRSSIPPSLSMLLSPIICFPCPSLSQKHHICPLTRVLLPSSTAAPATARRYSAPRGVTAPHQCLPVPSLAARLPEATGGSRGQAPLPATPRQGQGEERRGQLDVGQEGDTRGCLGTGQPSPLCSCSPMCSGVVKQGCPPG